VASALWCGVGRERGPDRPAVRRAAHQLEADHRDPRTPIAILHIGALAVPIAGISLMLGRYGGLYWLVVTILIYFLWSAINAWTLVVQAVEK
jgi:hypothetical protein